MINPTTKKGKQRLIINLLGKLAVQVALSGARQQSRKMVLNICSTASQATFYIYTVQPDSAKIDWADNLGFDMHAACKNPICFDSFSLQQDYSFTRSIQLLRNALETAKSL